MTGERIYLYDTTLRDGAQTQGVDFGVPDKLAIARELDRLGIDYIEGGWPGANPTDDAFFAKPPPLDHARLAAFGMTRRSGRSAANDPGLAAVLGSGARGRDCLVGKTWDFHVKVALGVEPRRKRRDDRESRSRRGRATARRGDVRRRAFLRRLQGQSRLRARLHQGRARGRRALDRAVRHQWRHPADEIERIVARGRRKIVPGDRSASIATTTPRTRWRTRWPRCAPARGRSRARSTGWASAAATPIWSRSSRT